MHVAIFMLIFMSKAFAVCQFQAMTKEKPVKPVALALKSTTGTVRLYEVHSGGFTAAVEFDPADKTLKARVIGPQGEPYAFNQTGADLLEELDCFGGSTGGNGFRFKCDSREWRDLQAKNGWPERCQDIP